MVREPCNNVRKTGIRRVGLQKGKRAVPSRSAGVSTTLKASKETPFGRVSRSGTAKKELQSSCCGKGWCGRGLVGKAVSRALGTHEHSHNGRVTWHTNHSSGGSTADTKAIISVLAVEWRYRPVVHQSTGLLRSCSASTRTGLLELCPSARNR